MVYTILGAVLALVVALVVRSTSTPRVERRLWALFLVIAAGIYVGFAVVAGAGLNQELIGLAIWCVLAWLGDRWAAWILPFGWASHALWDVGLHGFGGSLQVPGWYVAACLGFDLVAAVYLVTRLRTWTGSLGTPMADTSIADSPVVDP